MKVKWDAVFAALLSGCALVTTALVVRREFAAPVPEAIVRQPRLIQNWKPDVAQGVTFGPPDAAMQLIEFADFECPFCADFYQKVKSLRERHPSQVSLTYVHFPLQGHRFALPAARVAECAGEQGRFQSMYERLFEEQDGFGFKSWDEYAKEAAVPDLQLFDACIAAVRPVSRIEAGKQLGAKLGVNETPTLIVNGWMLGRPPTGEELDAMLKAVVDGKSPISAVHTS